MSTSAIGAEAGDRPDIGLPGSVEKAAMPIPAPPPMVMTAADMRTDVIDGSWIRVDGLFCKTETCGGPAYKHPHGNLLLGCPTCGFTVRAFSKHEKFTEIPPA